MQTTDNVTINRLLTSVARQGATDLHLTIGSPPIIRKDGDLFQLEQEEILTAHFMERVIETVLSEGDRLRLTNNGEILFTETFNKILRFRVHIYKQRGYYSVAFRYIPYSNKKIADLQLPSYLEKAVRAKRGLVVIAGVYDSGKSTTLSAIISTINELGPPRYITTLERPIEQLFVGSKCIIEQREVGKDIASYLQGLRMVLNEDIDTIVVDRLVDKPTTKRFLEVIEAGRSGIVTLDSSSSMNALSTLVGFSLDAEALWARKVVSNHLLCVLTQKLLHRIGGGRVLAYEFLVNTGIIPSLISSGNLDRIASVIKSSTEFEITSLDMSLARLVQRGEVRLEEALVEASDKNYLRSLLRQ